MTIEMKNGVKFRSHIWNMPIEHFDNRYDLFNDIIKKWLDGYKTSKTGKLKLLEIGVWKASTIKWVSLGFQNVFEYIGLDPYGNLIDDPYKGLFWNSTEESETVFREASQAFADCEGTLLRVSSDDYFADNQGMFDVVFVDGDHRYAPTLRDLNNGLDRLEPGGLLICDDVGNNFHPEVEWAVRDFYKERSADISNYGCHPLFFQLEGCPVPVMLQFAVFERK